MKKMLAKIVTIALLAAVLLPSKAFAGAEVDFQVRTDGAGGVTLVSENAAAKGVSSVQFGLTVSAGNAKVVDFEFSEGVKGTAKVLEARYQEESRTLNVYLAGTKPLFAAGATSLAVGKVVAYDADGKAVSVAVSAVAGSVKYVDGAELKELEIPSPTPSPTPTQTPSWPSTPSWPTTPEATPTPTPTATPTPSPTPTKEPTPTPAPAKKPQTLKSIKLYLGGDVTGQYPLKKYASVWYKADYTVTFKSDNKKVAKVGKTKGLVTAVGVGKANITVTFTHKETGEQIVRNCKVTVKRNAVDVGLTPVSTNRMKKLKVGDVYTLRAYREDSDGKKVWSGTTKITDTLRFKSSDTSVFKVGLKNGRVTAVGVGEATLTVWAIQAEGATYDENGKVTAYRPTTPIREFKVIVSEKTEEKK